MSWESQAASWIELARRPDDAYWAYRHHFFDLLPPPSGRVIELGCGEGRVARDLKERGYDVVGIDSAPTMVAAATALDVTGDYLVADAGSLPLEDESFDLAIAYNSLMDVDDIEAATHEAARVVRPGGRFCVCVTHPINDAGRFAHEEGPGAAFHIDVYRGRRPFDETIERDGVTLRFTGWCYPLEGYTRPLEDAGFLIETFREPAVDRTPASPVYGERRLRIPNFLMLRAVKPV